MLTAIFLVLASANAQVIQGDQKLNFKKGKKINVAFLIFDQVESLDLNGPVDIFTKASHADDIYNLYTVSLDKKAVNAEGNVLKMNATYSIQDAPKADILIIPGAFPPVILKLSKEHPELISWLKEQSKTSVVTMSVCTGALLLAEAGILDHKEATTHNLALELLKQYLKIKVVENIRYIQDGKILTTAGITSGFDGSLYLIDRINGKKVADRIAHMLIYNRNGDMSFMKVPVK